MLKLLLAVGCLILLHIFYIAFLNFDSNVTLHLFANLPLYSLKLTFAIISVSFYSILGASFVFYYILETHKGKTKKQSRIAEKAQIKSEESADRVKVLEAKIATLEKALKDALSK